MYHRKTTNMKWMDSAGKNRSKFKKREEDKEEERREI